MAAESVILTKVNTVFYLNSTLKTFSLENLELSFGTNELVFLIFFFLEKGGWKVTNEEQVGNVNSEVLSIAKSLYQKDVLTGIIESFSLEKNFKIIESKS